MERIAEICCGSLEDVLIAQKAGADRIELNSAMYLGGLTPSVGTIKLISEKCYIPIIAMVRPRPGGFYYNDYEFQTMLADIESMMDYNIQGIAFGCLDRDGSIDKEKSSMIIEIIHNSNKEAVFHRAFDCVKNPYEAIEILINLGVKRVLTSGLKSKAVEGVDLLAKLQNKYGDKIEILAGSGVNASNCSYLINETGIVQYHSSCKSWRTDPTTIGNISFAYGEPPHERDYYIVSYHEAIKFVTRVKKI